MMKKQNANISREEKRLIQSEINKAKVDSAKIQSIAISYLSVLCMELKISPLKMIEEIRRNKILELQILKSTRDAIIFAALAISVNPKTFKIAAESLKSMKWDVVEKMRRDLFIKFTDDETIKAADLNLNNISMNKLIFLAITK